ncbi:MAG: Sec-independent protein translocase protein TatB [Nitrospirota bacterium]
MPGLGFPSEIILIFIVALIVFGPKRLPDMAKSLGRAMNEFKRSMNDFKRQIETEVGTESIKEDLLRQQKEIQDKLAGLNPTGQGPAVDKIETADYADFGQAAANKASVAAAKAAEGKAGAAGQSPDEKSGEPVGQTPDNKAEAASGPPTRPDSSESPAPPAQEETKKKDA